MGKKVVVIASGETERRALPHLLAHLHSEDITLLEVRYPPRHNALNLEMAEKLVKASWFDNLAEPPDKFVVLLDTDGKSPVDVLLPFREHLPHRIGNKINAQVQFACANWHLEAWYFADVSSLREYLGRDPGSVDASKPDEIQNPKLHLKNLLGERAYTAVISEEIASRLDAQTIGHRSPSFQGFLDAVKNGQLAPKE
ncbi:MAG: DUF4276 family protein [Gemmataceae bacterium]|nr:DUF4276 family protein [Gemmataceae bacterium]MCI0740305.1 DUF4276 family protein [Gemmataceae bacterium]